MPVINSPNAIGQRQIVFDLSNANAYASDTFPNAPSQMQIGHIYVSGVTGAGDGTIKLRSDSASGPIVWQLEANVSVATRFIVDVPFESDCEPVFRGIYIDALSTAWASGSVLILYKR